MNTPLVIGYGNTLRSDDGAGVRAAELVRERVSGVDVLTVHELHPELVDVIAPRNGVIFIDAGADIDALTCLQLHDGVPPSPLASHMLSPGQLLALCSTLYGKSPQHAVLIEIPARTFAFGESLSPVASSAIEHSVTVIQSLIDTW